MNRFKADLHIHTILSPCGDLEMSPANIIEQAKKKGLDIIGITDHNSTRQISVIKKLAQDEGIFVLSGAEVTTKEEVHCLTFFEDDEKLEIFQRFLDDHLPDIKNNPDVFGYQVAVDENEEIVYQEEKLLISALDISIEDLEEMVHSLNGIFIPAHINKLKNSIISQLGFIPPDLNCDAVGISKHVSKDDFISKNKYLKNQTFTTSSDAHYPENIGDVQTIFHIEHRTFEEIKDALLNRNGRKVTIE